MTEIGDHGGSAIGDHFGPPTEEHRLIPEITYDEHLYPARPRRLRPSARRVLRDIIRSGLSGPTDGTNESYVKWLVEQSMLHDAQALATQLSGQGSMWQNPFADPDPRAAVERAAVWFTAYPLSFITRSGASFLSGLADPSCGGPFRRSASTPSTPARSSWPAASTAGAPPGRWTAISTASACRSTPCSEPRTSFATWAWSPARTMGRSSTTSSPDTPARARISAWPRWATRTIPASTTWCPSTPGTGTLLPDVPEGRDYVTLDVDSEAKLQAAGYIIGKLQRVIFYEPGVKETNWSATRVVKGVDGVERRWVYLHYFKAGQPSINWLDPSFAGMRLVIGDALHSLADLGSGALRLDANGFLGVEKSAEDRPAWSEGHPLSEAANQLIASMIRKMGGFSFQELNLTMDDIKSMAESGADLSYDFVNRPAYHHALATGRHRVPAVDDEPGARAGHRFRLPGARAPEP